ncbi:CHRD domain-containing protein [Actinomadura sp. ATCC 31491]|uniref:CHRD domain-containing protein n=1 Tax=Actinomadura luzonensis TaxID=2805427 RepID=A0ABT0FRS6_9ACTN|nr:CHRD domain-containing protein [Actinomadura luzonensis]MCK2215020.1 CHRD domain-containing protein [Actinomadura luzonensis]
MRRHLAAATLAAAAAATALVALPAPASASTAAGPAAAARVVLTGRQEVPGPGDRDGFGTFSYRVRGGKLCYVLTARRIAPAFAAHVHAGRRGVAGPIVVTLKAPAKGSASGCVKAVRHQNRRNAALVLTFRELRGIVRTPHRYYVNVHNAKFPKGAIRGQL